MVVQVAGRPAPGWLHRRGLHQDEENAAPALAAALGPTRIVQGGQPGSAASLASAFIDPAVTEIILDPGTYVMRPSLFAGYGQGRAKGLLALDRNITVRSADPANMASVDWAMMDATFLLKAGHSLTFDTLSLTNIRYGPGTGADFLHGKGAASVLWFRNVILLRLVCLPPNNNANVGLESKINTSMAPVGGSSSVISRPPSFCFNGTCYTDNTVHISNVAVTVVPGAEDLGQQAQQRSADTSYTWHLQNSTRLCTRTVDPSCLETSSASACYDSTYLQFQSELSSMGSPSANGHTDPAAIAVPASLGSAAVLAAAVALPLLLRRRRRRRRGRLPPGGEPQDPLEGQGPQWHGPQDSGYHPAWALLGHPGNGRSGGNWNVMAQGTAKAFEAVGEGSQQLADNVQLGVLIGAGSFGRVYKGRWQGREVAVKVMLHDTAIAKSVAREIDLVMSFQHDNIVQAYHFIAWDKRRSGGSSDTKGPGSECSLEGGFEAAVGDTYTISNQQSFSTPITPLAPGTTTGGSGATVVPITPDAAADRRLLHIESLQEEEVFEVSIGSKTAVARASAGSEAAVPSAASGAGSCGAASDQGPAAGASALGACDCGRPPSMSGGGLFRGAGRQGRPPASPTHRPSISASTASTTGAGTGPSIPPGIGQSGPHALMDAAIGGLPILHLHSGAESPIRADNSSPEGLPLPGKPATTSSPLLMPSSLPEQQQQQQQQPQSRLLRSQSDSTTNQSLLPQVAPAASHRPDGSPPSSSGSPAAAAATSSSAAAASDAAGSCQPSRSPNVSCGAISSGSSASQSGAAADPPSQPHASGAAGARSASAPVSGSSAGTQHRGAGIGGARPKGERGGGSGSGIRGEAQTWLILEYCDQGNLADLVQSGMLHDSVAGSEDGTESAEVEEEPEHEGEGEEDEGQGDTAASGDQDRHREESDKERRLARRRQLPADLPRALRLLLDVARGMAYLHARNVIHGDLKCQNVLLITTPGASWGQAAKISDFGLSKALGLNQTHVTTQSMGTVTHMPPELFKTGRMSPAGDVYAFGVMAWEVLTGCGAFHGMHYAEVIEQVAIRGVRPPIPEATPPELRAMIEACWQADPTKRPGFDTLVTCLELLLSRYLSLAAQGPVTGSSSGPSITAIISGQLVPQAELDSTGGDRPSSSEAVPSSRGSGSAADLSGGCKSPGHHQQQAGQPQSAQQHGQHQQQVRSASLVSGAAAAAASPQRGLGRPGGVKCEAEPGGRRDLAHAALVHDL